MSKPDKPPNPNRDISNAETRAWRQAVLDGLAAIKDALGQTTILSALADRLDAHTAAMQAVIAGTVIPGATRPLTLHKETQMAGELDRITASVTSEITVGDSMAVLLGQLSDIIRNMPQPVDAAALNALADTVDAKTAEWTAAVTANTPAA